MIYIFFTVVTLALTYSLREDFSVDMRYSLGLIFAISMALFAPFYQTHLLSMFSIVAAIVLCFTQMFLKFKPIKLSSNEAISLYDLFEFPSSEKVIILFVILNWQISLFSFFPLAAFSYPFVVHDILLVVGLFILTNWIKQSMQTSDLPHNHMSKFVTVVGKDGNYKEQISNLKKNMRIEINQETILPVACKTLTACRIGSTQSESQEWIRAGTTVSSNTVFFSGSVNCQNDFEQVTHNFQSKNTESSDRFLSIFMIATLLIAISSGLWFGYVAGSVVVGLQSFCLNLIVSCPCVFLIAKPLINTKFLDWLTTNSLFQFNKMPNVGKPNILVFDRTHTLYERDPNNKDGPFILNKGIYDMLKSLKNDDVQCYILSGHGTGGWENNLKRCKNDLIEAIDPKNIIFHSQFHDPNEGRKRDVIKNLQFYGSLNKPKTPWEQFSCRLQRFFTPNIVGMIGDGDNDVAAMRQADVSVCVAKEKSSYNSDVLKTANFCVEQKDLSTLPDMINALGNSNSTSKLCIKAAFISNIVLLALVNGLSSYLFGIHISASLACSISFVFCTLLLLATSCYKVSVPERKIASDIPCCNSNSLCCDDKKLVCHLSCCKSKQNIHKQNLHKLCS
ncbi:MAG: HAD family hydrolase [Pseudomonadota bacterium]|nr:HAD family hydrolase [Pseudomonadota bacterium]